MMEEFNHLHKMDIFFRPQRVCIKDEEIPGLAVTRSFGDRVAATVGVMSEPEIKEFSFTEEYKSMINASDGQCFGIY